jgi:PHD/YefM family antitoxin component YafN of YafNO toxin-antitoxin module
MTIVPMRDLKDTVKIENLCLNNKEPVFITKNGYGKLVVMDIALFEQMMNELYIAKALKEGIDDVKNGNVKDASQVFEEMKLKYGL